MKYRVRLAQALPVATLRIALLASLLLLGAALSQTARAASDSFIDCDRLASDLRSLEVPDSELPLDDADHLKPEDVAALDGPLKAQLFGTETIAPVLLLAPRVAAIMREIFNAALPDDDDDREPASANQASASAAPASSAPVVKVPPSMFEAADGGEAASHFMPRFQRQMYRTDI
ncbi:MAG: hypothetical protein U5K76_06040 [Woeseiaceae bacterium]|nr:hypothetical protein [Woeseiaceae bacterium]